MSTNEEKLAAALERATDAEAAYRRLVAEVLEGGKLDVRHTQHAIGEATRAAREAAVAPFKELAIILDEQAASTTNAAVAEALRGVASNLHDTVADVLEDEGR